MALEVDSAPVETFPSTETAQDSKIKGAEALTASKDAEVKDEGKTQDVKDSKEDKDSKSKTEAKTDKEDLDPKAAKGEDETAEDEKDKPQKDSKSKTPEEGRIVELSRSKRAAEAKATQAQEKVKELEASLEKYKPLINLLDVAAKDPLEFVTQMAEATGLSPDRVKEAIATKAAGGTPQPLAVEEKIAALEKRLADKEAADALAREQAETERKTREYAQAREANVQETLKFLQANAELFPAAEADGEEAASAIYEVVEARWAALKKAGRAPTSQDSIMALYRQAAEKINAILVEQTERRAAKLGYQRQPKSDKAKEGTASKKDAPKSFKGLSSDETGRNSPPRDPKRIWTDEEILAAGDSIFFGSGS